jgi:hypothetical protein
LARTQNNEQDKNLLSRVVCRLTDLPGSGPPELMAFLEKTFGETVTTRNWNSVLKIVQ